MKDKLSNSTLYAVPVWKFIILWVLTGGIYNIYWFYKQWKGVKQIENLKASPFARAAFSGIWIFSLLSYIFNITKKNDKKFLVIFLAIIYIVFSYVPYIPIFPRYYITLFLFSLSFLPLIPAQIAINKHQKNVLSAKLTKPEIILFILGLILSSLMILGYSEPSNIQKITPTPIINNTSIDINNWKLFTSTEGNFKILFPSGNPKLTTDIYNPLLDYPDLKYHILQYLESDTNGDGYWVEVTVYPEIYGLVNSYDNLNSFKKAIQENLENLNNTTLVNSEQSTFKGSPSIDLELKNKDSYYKYRIFIIGGYSYGIASSSRSSDFPKFDKFANSFQFLQTSLPVPTASAVDTGTGFLSGKDNVGDIKFLQDYMNRIQVSKNDWQDAYSNGEFSKQDLDKLLDELSRIVSFTKTIISNLQSGDGSINDNISLWKTMMKMHNEAVSVSNRMTGQ